MKRIEIETFLGYSFPNSVSYNPSGTVAAFALSVPDRKQNCYQSSIWFYEEGRFEEAFAIGQCRKYLWEDDENILYLDNFDRDYTEILRGNIRSKKVEKVCSFRLNIKEIARLENGRIMAICRTDVRYPDIWRSSDEELEKIRRQQEEEADYQIVDELPYCKNGIPEFIAKQRNTIFILDLEQKKCRRVTDTLFQTERYCIEGNTIYFNGSAYETKMCVFQELWSYQSGDEAPKCLYNGRKYNMRGLGIWNGHLMIFGNTNPNVKLFHSEFYIADKETGEISSFCRYDKSIRSYVTGDCAFGEARLYQTDEGKLYFLSTIRNETWLMVLNEDGKVNAVIQHEGAICDFDVRNGKVFFTALWNQRPLECYEADLHTGNIRKLSGYHDHLQKECYIAKPQPYTFQFDGWEIDGWALMPMGYEPDKRYPAVLDIHGGPNACYSEAYCHEMQVWASRGFFVLFCNPVGSEGRGDAFMNIHGHFGDRDYACIMKFVDEMLEKYPQIDRKKLCVTGGSYGGFMTNWMITHTDRFAAAATQRSICNWITAVLLCDNGWYNMPLQMQGDVYTGTEKLWEQSPLKYIQNVKTPTLILHSDEDYSVPMEEGMQLYSALVCKGVETRLVRFKGENHELSRSGRPLQRLRRLKEITDWLEKYVGNHKQIGDEKDEF